MVDGHPVCRSCAYHYLPLVVCPACNRTVRRITRAPAPSPHEKVCAACLRKAQNHKTCSICRKHRPVAGCLPDGKPYCKACTPGQQKTHKCPDCDRVLPGAGASRCRGCANRQALASLLEELCPTISQPWGAALLRQYGEGQLQKSPEDPGLIKFVRGSHPFFRILSDSFAMPEEITAPALLQVFGTKGLRGFASAAMFLQKTLGIEFSADQKQHASISGMVNALLQSTAGTPHHTLLTRYHVWLSTRDISPSTLRAYLTAAHSFALFANLTDTAAWDSAVLSRFLDARPGCRASLFPYAEFCTSMYGVNAKIPVLAQP